MKHPPKKNETERTRSIAKAARALRAGEIVAFPTETVYGLGANALNENAVRKIFIAKGRPSDNPLIVHIYSEKQLPELVKEIPAHAKKLMKAFWPGPLSIVFHSTSAVAPSVRAGLATVCVRMPVHPVARKLLRAANIPIAAPSANTSGRPSPTTWKHVEHDLGGKIPLILQGNPSTHGIESTVIDCTKKIPTLLRPGSISLEELQKVVGKVNVIGTKNTRAGSPGLRHKHYSPNARVVLIKNPTEIPRNAPKSAYIGIIPSKKKIMQENPHNATQYARALFRFFRVCEQKGIQTIYAQTISLSGVGRGLMDRLKRAAEK